MASPPAALALALWPSTSNHGSLQILDRQPYKVSNLTSFSCLISIYSVWFSAKATLAIMKPISRAFFYILISL